MIRIISDSTCDIPACYVEQYDIGILPLHVVFEDKDFLDGIDISPEDIFDFVERNGVLPKTASANLFELTEYFNQQLKKYEEVIFITVSSEMSGLNNTAHVAAARCDAPERIRIVDSRNFSSGLGMVTAKAAIMAASGMSSDEIVAELAEFIPRVRFSFIIDTFDYIYKGGRCSAVSAFMGNALKIHPVLTVENGFIKITRKYMGTMRFCLKKFAREIDYVHASEDRIILVISMPYDEPVVGEMREIMTDGHSFGDFTMTQAGGMISCHCGPGASGIAYVEQ